MRETNAKDYWESLHRKSYGCTASGKVGSERRSTPRWTGCDAGSSGKPCINSCRAMIWRSSTSRAFANLASLVKLDGLLVFSGEFVHHRNRREAQQVNRSLVRSSPCRGRWGSGPWRDGRCSC
jgi:hypothetical protein